MRGEALEDFGAQWRVERWGAKGRKKPTLDFRMRQMAPRFPHDSNALLRRVRSKTLHGSEGNRVAGVSFESGAKFPKGVRDAALLFIQVGETKFGMIIDRIQLHGGSIIGASLLRIAASQIQIAEIIVGFPIGVGFG